MYSYLYLSYAQILSIHDYVLDVSWWHSGFLHEWKNSLVVDMMCSDDYYPSFVDKVSYMLYGLAMSHEFIDWNKRTALMSTAQFILLNTSNKKITNTFIKKFENIVVWIADGQISKEAVAWYVASFLWRHEQTESVLLKIHKELHSQGLIQ